MPEYFSQHPDEAVRNLAMYLQMALTLSRQGEDPSKSDYERGLTAGVNIGKDSVTDFIRMGLGVYP
jgi:hypothetical protein